MHKSSRRSFLKTAGAGAAAGTLMNGVPSLSIAKAKVPFELGVASYTFRKFSMEDTVAMVKKMGIKNVAFKSFHLPLDANDAKIRWTKTYVANEGLNLYGCGVVYMKTEDQVNEAFEYAQKAGMKMIIGVPNHELLPLVDKKVKEYNIPVAIHNHGPGDEVYPSPKSVYDKIKNFDKRIGLCIDMGHTQRIGVNPTDAAKKYKDRLLDIHIKDVTKATPEGKTCEVGRGIIDIPKFLKTLIKIKYAGNVSLEFEKDEEDPLAGSAESIGYIKGVLAVI
jgi:inosose dehydratase